MKKETINLVTFILAVVSILVFTFTLNVLAMGFGLLFGSMFIIDSFWYMVKKKFVEPKSQPIGGVLK